MGQDAYTQLEARSREVSLLNRIGAVLGWDQQTYLPRQANAYRAIQTSWLSATSHRLFTAREVGDWIKQCEDAQLSDPVRVANVREWRRQYDRATRLPVELVEEISRVTTLAHEEWERARQQSDFTIFRKPLEKIVGLVRQSAEHYGYGEHPYDALLESYEPGMSTRMVGDLFSKLAPQVSQLVRSAGRTIVSLPKGPYPEEAQKAFNRLVAESMGFDFQRGRIDTAAHPFCTDLGPDDVRLTTRYDVADFTSSLYGVLHETGHGLYEQGLRAEHHGTPAGSSVSLGVHESQSRLWENHVGRSLGFWEVWMDKAVEHFPQLRTMTPELMVRYVNRIEPSRIRVEADEVTYDLHIILRFSIEKRLIEGSLQVADLPEVWNAEFEKMFGLKVPDDARGCLQDVHWSGGALGYFPTYTIGNLNAAQLFEAASRSAEVEDGVRIGVYGPLLEWMRCRIHRHGSVHLPTELIREASGNYVTPEAFLRHLESRVALTS